MAENPARPKRSCGLLSCGEFCYIALLDIGEDFIPCTWVLWVVRAQNVYDNLIENHCLAISLGRESHGLSKFCIQHQPETWPKCTQEYFVPIWDNGLWDPKVYPHSLKEKLSIVLYCDTLLAGCHDGYLREFFDDHKNAIVAMFSRRKAPRVIHGDIFPRPTRSR